MTQPYTATVILDTKRLLCPMPLIKLQQQARSAKPGDIIQIESTDPGVLQDFPAWCRIHGHETLEQMEDPTTRIITSWIQITKQKQQ